MMDKVRNDQVQEYAAWLEADRAAWEAAAQELEADGYTRRSDAFFPAIFIKVDAPTMALFRPLGVLTWEAREA